MRASIRRSDVARAKGRAMKLSSRFLAAVPASIVLLPGCGGGSGGGTSGSGSNLISVVGGRNGMLLTGGVPVTLAVEVKTRGGAPVSGMTVSFLAPRTGATGDFSNPGPAGSFMTTSATDASGRASATFTPRVDAGVYLADAFMEGTPTVTTFAMTNTMDPPAVALSADQARSGKAAVDGQPS
jgi:hypothetical protein